VVILLGIAFVAGIITAISPCVLPVLPILVAGGASGGGRRRPFAIIAGLVASFTLFTLAGTAILKALGLPADFLRNLAIALLFVLAATLLVPAFARLLERPFLPLTRRRAGSDANGLVLGASLGLVFVPCAGPVLAAMTAIAASGDVGVRTILVTLAYALGAGLPMLLFVLGGRRLAGGLTVLRTHAAATRRVAGVILGATALAIALGVDEHFTTALPGYTSALQSHVENTSAARRELRKIRTTGGGSTALASGTSAQRAPDFAGISTWINTPGGKSLSLRRNLRGKVVLVDFWTYSCVNCLRTLPHLEAWDAAYRKSGLVIVGVHTPEFAFEHDEGNVRSAVKRLGVRYPVAIDNDYKTWNAYLNQYWPADYLVDRTGRIRDVHFGEGAYADTERTIRRLLGDGSGSMTNVADKTPHDLTTPESYLGAARLERFASGTVKLNRVATYRFPTTLDQNDLAYSGRWRVEVQRILAVRDARLRLHFHARHVYLVMGGHGAVRALVKGKRVRTIRVAGIPRLYTILDLFRVEDSTLELRFTPGVSAYAFTFG
jgi:cytochrome c biogenesis protein CcdA/thiol-disulfide isomerase/thioredoxin